MSKLIKRGISIIIVRLLYFWCQHQLFTVRWGDNVSEPFTVLNGVRQGGIASPIYFNLYLDELSSILNEYDGGCVINTCKINHLFYADDSVLMAPSPVALQCLINLCEKYANDYELSFNVKKTKVMCFKPKKLRNLHVPTFTINDRNLEQVCKQKYLGVIIDEELCDNTDMNRQVKSIYSKGNVLIRKFLNCSADVKARLFRSYCCSFYCDFLWCNYTLAIFRKLQTSYNMILRNLFKFDRADSMSHKCILIGIDCLKVLMRKNVFSFRERVLSSANILVTGISRSTFFNSCLLVNKWQDLLFSFVT